MGNAEPLGDLLYSLFKKKRSPSIEKGVSRATPLKAERGEVLSVLIPSPVLFLPPSNRLSEVRSCKHLLFAT